MAVRQPDLVMRLTDDVVAAISAHRFTCSSERELQDAVARVLEAHGFDGDDCDVDREVPISENDRIDLIVCRCGGPHLGIELKTKGSTSEIARQLERYAASLFIDGLLLVTTRYSHVATYPDFHGKPVRVVRVATGGL